MLSLNRQDIDSKLVTKVQNKMATFDVPECTQTNLETYQERSKQVAAMYP
jgi:hypothetical protein